MKELKEWFLKNRRPLPWRASKDPYAIWISEVMLQQTTAAAVIPYFERWMRELPTVESLAEAAPEKVMKLWEGLGYYSRARNLMKAASLIQEQGGELPKEPELLKKLPGIGDYTSSAIAAFAFQKKVAAIDGNVLRFLSRFLALEDDIADQATKRKFQIEANRLLPDKEPWLVAEAMIELGATVCRKKPDCLGCPVRTNCLAFKEEKQYSLPFSSKKQLLTLLDRTVIIVRWGDQFLLKEPSSKGLMADLWEFPYYEGKEPSFANILSVVPGLTAADWQNKKPLASQKQYFTRFAVTLYPLLFSPLNSFSQSGLSWYSIAETEKKTFSSGHRRIMEGLL